MTVPVSSNPDLAMSAEHGDTGWPLVIDTAGEVRHNARESRSTQRLLEQEVARLNAFLDQRDADRARYRASLATAGYRHADAYGALRDFLGSPESVTRDPLSALAWVDELMKRSAPAEGAPGVASESRAEWSVPLELVDEACRLSVCWCLEEAATRGSGNPTLKLAESVTVRVILPAPGSHHGPAPRGPVAEWAWVRVDRFEDGGWMAELQVGDRGGAIRIESDPWSGCHVSVWPSRRRSVPRAWATFAEETEEAPAPAPAPDPGADPDGWLRVFQAFFHEHAPRLRRA